MRGSGAFLNGFKGPAEDGSGDGDAAGGKRPAATVALTASRSDGLATSIVVPAALTLAALTLAGSAVVRRRRLASRSDRR
jgi:hypothetical protein